MPVCTFSTQTQKSQHLWDSRFIWGIRNKNNNLCAQHFLHHYPLDNLDTWIKLKTRRHSSHRVAPNNVEESEIQLKFVMEKNFWPSPNHITTHKYELHLKTWNHKLTLKAILVVLSFSFSFFVAPQWTRISLVGQINRLLRLPCLASNRVKTILCVVNRTGSGLWVSDSSVCVSPHAAGDCADSRMACSVGGDSQPHTHTHTHTHKRRVSHCHRTESQENFTQFHTRSLCPLMHNQHQQTHTHAHTVVPQSNKEPDPSHRAARQWFCQSTSSPCLAVQPEAFQWTAS